MQRSYRAGSRRAEYVESLKNRSEMLLNGEISDALMRAEGHPLEEILIRRSCCLRIGRISNDLVRNFYANFVLKWIESYLAANLQGHEDGKRLIVIEEAHGYYYAGLQKRSDLREPIVLSLAREIRKLGVSLVFVDQLVSILPKQVLGNIDLFIVFRIINSSCIRAISEACNLSWSSRAPSRRSGAVRRIRRLFSKGSGWLSLRITKKSSSPRFPISS
jgi:DNA helicase HerA-like ATPase